MNNERSVSFDLSKVVRVRFSCKAKNCPKITDIFVEDLLRENWLALLVNMCPEHCAMSDAVVAGNKLVPKLNSFFPALVEIAAGLETGLGIPLGISLLEE